MQASMSDIPEQHQACGTEMEAMRVARFVQSLAFSSDQPAITAGETPAD